MKKLFIILSVLAAFSSCNGFLDEIPDQRTEVNTGDKITKLLVSAYPSSSAMLMSELASDNIMDNGAQFDASVFQEEMYLWKPCTGTDVDGPNGLWQSCYTAISAANMALKSIEELGEAKTLIPRRVRLSSAGHMLIFFLPTLSACSTIRIMPIHAWEFPTSLKFPSTSTSRRREEH
jgi:hypothetical protein